VGPEQLPVESPNGEGWCLRAYPDVSALVAVEPVDTASPICPFPMRPRKVKADYPCWEDVPIRTPDTIANKYYELFENTPGFKIGGWPTLIQSEIFWAPWNRHPAAPEYVFQIDTTEKGNWMWGDNGVGYFGRGTAEGHTDQWALSWQCY